jgi:LemA protein
MGNELDELTGPQNPDGRDVSVIDKQLSVEVQAGTKVFEAAMLFGGLPVAAFIGFSVADNAGTALLITLLGAVPGLIFQWMKANARSYLQKLQQKVQADASLIDNHLEQRVIILQNLATLLEKAIDLDKDVMKSIAALRSGIDPSGAEQRNQLSSGLDGVASRINVAVENYPELKAQENIAEAMRQNTYLQKEITAARTLYNDTVTRWNQDIFDWPTKQIVAARAGYTTRIPFTASAATKSAARENFFK